MALTSSRGDIDFYSVDFLLPLSDEQRDSARLYVADTAARNQWPAEETKDLLGALGLLEEKGDADAA